MVLTKVEEVYMEAVYMEELRTVDLRKHIIDGIVFWNVVSMKMMIC